MPSAVVFAYHNVGYRCLSVLLAQGIDVKLVVSHQDNPAEKIWFQSVAQLAALHGIAVITPEDPNTPEVIAHIKNLAPDFLFSFYYRLMLKRELLAIPTRGAFNMHGSLLPQYRGRVPVNWAIIHGESETGATLHAMTEKPDNGDIVDQQAVPILPDDTAAEVFGKVTVAAEMTLHRCLPALINGSATLRKQNLSLGKYFGGRNAEDGRINWQQSALQIHNLIRAVTTPFPGAFTEVNGKPLKILRSLVAHGRAPRAGSPTLYLEDGKLFADCGSGVLRIVELELDGKTMPPESLPAYLQSDTLLLQA
jgi:methionyl-tRNA formyltransferase